MNHGFRFLFPLLAALLVAAVLAGCAGSGSTSATPGRPDWIRDAQSGCAVWNPIPQAGETITWSGGCADGRAHGRGTLVFYQNGQERHRYDGDFKGGYLDGHVMYSTPDGYRFEGMYAKDQKVKGVERYLGYRYEGEFRNDRFHGQGVLTWPDGRVEKGLWENGALVSPR